MIGFAASLIVGITAELETETILWRALIVMIPCWWIGRLVGALAVHTVETQVREYKLARPIPSDYVMSSDVEILDDENEPMDAEVSTPQEQPASAASNG
ncbi:MAG TPA: hypothetical protein DER01_14285 [Phycisphaerales bacterium]|nr:hypothetical protein [Phycisphaerales bacterium]